MFCNILRIIFTGFLLSTYVYASDAPSSLPDRLSFELKLKDLSESEYKSVVNFSWSYNYSLKSKTAFLKCLPVPDKDLYFVRNPKLLGSDWTALELKDKKPVALYMDLNTDGALSDGEKLLPLLKNHDPKANCEFLTPEFFLNTKMGYAVPYKLLCKVYIRSSGMIKIRWTPYCYWEGETRIDKKAYRLSLYDANGNGCFQNYGRDYYGLVKGEKSVNPSVPLKDLSSRIVLDGNCYKLLLSGKETKKGGFSISLEKDSSPTGNLQVEWAGNKTSRVASCNLVVRGELDPTIVFRLNGLKNRLPGGCYVIEDGILTFMNQGSSSGQAYFKCFEGFDIKPNETSVFKINKPKVEFSVYGNQKDLTEGFPKDSEIKIKHKILGNNGELYHMFTQSGNEFSVLHPKVSILDPKGEEVASGFMEYG